jgi:putative thioredoxin
VLAASQPAEAARILATAAPGGRLQPEIDRLAAELRVRGDATDGAEDEARLVARLAEKPDDLAARLALGRVLASAGRYEEAFEAFLDVIRRDREFDDGAARRAMLDLFTLLGREDPRADRYQRELARVLYA